MAECPAEELEQEFLLSVLIYIYRNILSRFLDIFYPEIEHPIPIS